MAFTDAFTDTNGTALSTHDANWVVVGNAGLEVQSNQAEAISSSSETGNRYNQTFAAAHYSKATLTAVNGGWIGPLVRGQGTNNWYYCFDGNGTLFNGQNVAGTFTDWDSGLTVSGVNDVIELSIDSTTTTTVYFKRNGSIVATYTGKSALTGGQAGLTCYNGTTSHVDNWEGGDVAGAAARPPLQRTNRSHAPFRAAHY